VVRVCISPCFSFGYATKQLIHAFGCVLSSNDAENIPAFVSLVQIFISVS